MAGIYIIKNLVNNKVYIGQSVDVKSRLQHHRSELRHNRHANSYLQNSWNKYGEENFEFSVLELCDEDQLDELERRYIKEYDAMDRDYGYNRESGGSLNKHPSEEVRKQMSERMKGKYVGEKNPWYGKHREIPMWHRELLSKMFSGSGNPMYGVHREHTEEENRRASERMKGEGNPFYGKHHTEETRRIISEKAKGRKFSDEMILKMKRGQTKRVRCINNGMEFDAISFAAKWAGNTAPESISRVCKGKQKTAGFDPITKEKYRWEFI